MARNMKSVSMPIPENNSKTFTIVPPRLRFTTGRGKVHNTDRRNISRPAQKREWKGD